MLLLKFRLILFLRLGIFSCEKFSVCSRWYRWIFGGSGYLRHSRRIWDNGWQISKVRKNFSLARSFAVLNKCYIP
jgi:hypothetical protein